MKTIKGSELQDKTLEVLENGTLRIMDSGKFIPRIGEKFCLVDIYGNICNYTYLNNRYFNYLVVHQPTFRTEEECEEYKNYLDLLDEYKFEPNWWDNNYRYSIFYLDKEDEVCPYAIKSYFHDINYYFETREKSREFIKKVGKDNLKKFMFNIWE